MSDCVARNEPGSCDSVFSIRVLPVHVFVLKNHVMAIHFSEMKQLVYKASNKFAAASWVDKLHAHGSACQGQMYSSYVMNFQQSRGVHMQERVLRYNCILSIDRPGTQY